MRKLIVSLSLVCMALAIAVAPVNAAELWDQHLRGVDIGAAAGALPPAGLYFVNNLYYIDLNFYGQNGGRDNVGAISNAFRGGTTLYKNTNGGLAGSTQGLKLPVLVDAPILLWSTGLKVAGADLGMAIAQPFDFTAVTDGASQWGTFNTIIIPAILSWKLPADFRVAAKLAVYLPDATSAPGYAGHSTWASRGGAIGGLGAIPTGNGYWTFMPELGVSWLHAGWNISVAMGMSFNTENNWTQTTSGSEFWADYTVTKTIGKWTVGLGAYSENQLWDDTGLFQNLTTGKTSRMHIDARNTSNPNLAAQSFQVFNGPETNFGMGPIIGYNFGPVIVTANYNWNIYTRNDVGGANFLLRAVVPLKFCE